ncbi:MAG: cheR-type protein glutamate methyltransferase [Osedax symbiont Rs2]|nr:MAG: cheR-type protein glutamate methyltransferase [Osedax symbiont Rs2]
MELTEIADIEIDTLLDAIRRRYDYDFSNYARSSLKRRINGLLVKEKLDMPYQLIPRILYDEEVFNRFLSELSVTVTEMYREPEFFLNLVESIFPVLNTYQYFKIWHAGCATGEEAYSLAVLLKEAGLLNRAKIYATDYNNKSIDIAKQGIYSAENIEQSSKGYLKAGGKQRFSDHYSVHYEAIQFDDELKNAITFAYHNLVKDGVFGEMNLIICRNVFIYFDKDLQNHVLNLFNESAISKGFLCLGNKETIRFSILKDKFMTLSESNSIYRKKQ